MGGLVAATTGAKRARLGEEQEEDGDELVRVPEGGSDQGLSQAPLGVGAGEGSPCKVCQLDVGVRRRCWGCGYYMHAGCAGEEHWGLGPRHCD